LVIDFFALSILFLNRIFFNICFSFLQTILHDPFFSLMDVP